MKKAIVDVPECDYAFFQKLMPQNGWLFEWANDGQEYPEDVDDD